MDQNTFINTYIDVIIGSLQDHLKANLQLQTQLKVNEFVIAEKDNIISSLTKQLEENKIAEDWKVKYESLERNYAAVVNKVSHMETLLIQLSEMKKAIISKDAEIAKLQNQSAKKVINRKAKKSNEDVAKEQSKEPDDF